MFGLIILPFKYLLISIIRHLLRCAPLDPVGIMHGNPTFQLELENSISLDLVQQIYNIQIDDSPNNL